MIQLLQDFSTRAVIFDMDGLLIDSEPYWKMAEKKVFGELGLDLTDELLRQVMGFRLSEVVKHWHTYQPWNNADLARTETDVLETVRNMILDHAEPMPGVYDVLELLHSNGYPMAVASSSAMSLIEAVLEKLQIRHYFSVIWSAEFEPYGKPHPGIFITAAEKLSVPPSQCLVLEDSINGVIAAKAARMRCIAVPELATSGDPGFAIADLKVDSLGRLVESW
jgi:HAD superfamily hydrolase (TIGR01509 family)